jgi:ABC-2 type transport system permease protein
VRNSAGASVVTTRPAKAGRVSLVATARVLIRLAWARTVSPVLLLGIVFVVCLPMLFALVFASRGSLSGDPVEFLVRRYDELVCALATPLIALLLGTSAFSAETDDGTLLYLVTTTTPRWWIVAVRTLFASVLTGAISSLAVWGTGGIAAGLSDPEHVTTAFTVAVFYGGATYAALFTALALLTRRALVSGLVYVLFWEGALSGTFPALHYLSVRQWMLAVAAEFTDSSDARLVSGPNITFALIAAVFVAAFTIYVGGRRLHQPRISRIGT